MSHLICVTLTQATKLQRRHLGKKKKLLRDSLRTVYLARVPTVVRCFMYRGDKGVVNPSSMTFARVGILTITEAMCSEIDLLFSTGWFTQPIRRTVLTKWLRFKTLVLFIWLSVRSSDGRVPYVMPWCLFRNLVSCHFRM